MMDHGKTLLNAFIRDRKGKVVLWQRPNLPIMVWATARVLAWPLRGSAEHFIGLVGTGAILLWALLELFQGATYFRRALGLVILAATFMSLTS